MQLVDLDKLKSAASWRQLLMLERNMKNHCVLLSEEFVYIHSGFNTAMTRLCFNFEKCTNMLQINRTWFEWNYIKIKFLRKSMLIIFLNLESKQKQMSYFTDNISTIFPFVYSHYIYRLIILYFELIKLLSFKTSSKGRFCLVPSCAMSLPLCYAHS